MIYNGKSVFLSGNVSLLWLDNVCGVYLVQVSLLLIDQQGLRDFFRFRPYWLEDCANFTPTPEESALYSNSYS
jgi:hypothetical protein